MATPPIVLVPALVVTPSSYWASCWCGDVPLAGILVGDDHVRALVVAQSFKLQTLKII